MPFMNKRALVTGASQGLGAAIARALAAEGCHVLVNCAHSVAKAEGVVSDIRDAGGAATVCCCDVSDEAAVRALFATEVDHGGIAILVNNARLDPYTRPPGTGDGEWFDRTMAVNLRGAFFCALAALEQMKAAGWGRIVNISSTWAHHPAPRPLMEYAMSKAGLSALTRSLALQGAPYGITANTVSPGLILTEGLASRMTPETLSKTTEKIPLRCGGDEAEIAQIVVHTLSQRFMTGEAVNVNGGTYMP